MNQPSAKPERPAARAPVFFWITIAQLALLLLGGVAAAVWLVFEARSINRSGGWGWLLVGASYVVVTTVVCASCACCTAVSLFRQERYRGLATVILVISGLVVLAFGPMLVRAVNGLRHQYAEARASQGSSRPSAEARPRQNIQSATDRSPTAPVSREVENPQILELKSKLLEAIRAKNADAFVDCFFIEDRFNTREIRQANRNQAEILMSGETIGVEIREIPARELVEIMKIQNTKAAGALRYSLVPRMILRIQQEARNGRVGRSFLIGEQKGKWYIVTMAGHTT